MIRRPPRSTRLPYATLFRAADLRKLGVQTTRAAGFVTIGGRRPPDVRWASHLSLWDARDKAGARAATYEFSPGIGTTHVSTPVTPIIPLPSSACKKNSPRSD